jgi:hypothetical protein
VIVTLPTRLAVTLAVEKPVETTAAMAGSLLVQAACLAMRDPFELTTERS